MGKSVSVGQIMAEVLCVDAIDEVDFVMYSKMRDCFNAMSFESRSKLYSGIGQYLKDCGVEVVD